MKKITPLSQEAKKLKQDKEIEQELRRIYTKDGKMPNFKKFEHMRGSRTKLLLIGLVAFFAVLAVSAWAGFFILKPYEKFGGKGVQFKIEGPKKIASGKEIEIELHYFNNEGVPLAESSINLLLTPGFVIKESNPEQTEPGEWNLGSLEKGEKGKIEVKGIIVGGKDDKATLTGYMTYKPANFNSDFEKVASYTADIESTVLGIEADGASEVAPGEEIEYTIRYRNLADEEIQDIAVNPVLPEEFIFATSTPPQNKSKMWFFEKLSPEEEGEIKLKGVYSSEASGNIEQLFQVGFIITGDKFVLQEETEVPLEITKSDLVLSLFINGGRSGAVNFGDTLNSHLSFKNDGSDDLEDIEIRVFFDAEPKIGSRNPLVGGTQSLVWDKSDSSRLDTLGSGEEGTVDFSVDLVSYALSEDEDHVVSVWAEAVIGRKAGKRINRTVQSTKLEVDINSNLILQSLGRYFDDDDVAIGSGPLPPRVGETTSYKIFWRLGNTLHDLNDIVVSTTLPSGVSWEGESSSEQGNVSYNETSRKITWQIDDLPKTIIATEASFSVAVTPESSDDGEVLTILGKTNLDAHDAETGGVIVLSAPTVSSNLIGDTEAEGRGTVIEL
ncbi:MAG: hypothetical protein U9P90_00180 [Patescibacteria group bacterium]|nr:hypothetical protein [Patescibacteria group bacterium]